jgi:hypothetical protein
VVQQPTNLIRSLDKLPVIVSFSPMNTFLKAILFILTALSAMFFTGCTYVDDGQSNVPWARPAEFENNLPGLGGIR